ncbi:PIN domain-like protein [Fragilariopsis cylindrus CCMP1102]|uniref:Flap endonuclease 1 n=1 Tax=Fragilariopsis cylindrus CCMP1102 TaxID=635003 RepID=A0A1E7FPD9_9STRA|nr:PIN domain-like protein [Fragilariopsis cylindrus CCMP1102]|eukprot:OEU20030.1 PIN domain-like protein [Fragilariopsis cylindrus CCMP1102]
MGIKGLAKLLSDEAPDCIREVEFKSLHGRKVAIDASMAIYQFLIAVRSGGPNQQAMMLTNADGETTSHIQGMFNRTIRFLTEGMKPVFVFDGKAPQMKSGELEKRREKRKKAEEELKKAADDDNVEEMDKHSKRLARAGRKENEDCKKLLRLMGVPVVVAPMEAEAQAAALCKAGLVYATGTEDMDALTFATPILIRKMTFANQAAKGAKIQQMNYKKAVEGLELTHEQFVDLCILMGCDYCDTIKGIGPKTALKLIKEHGSIEKIIPALQDEKPVPAYVLARELFFNHEVDTDVELKWTAPKKEELTKFLVEEAGFNADRVKASIEKLDKAHTANRKPQARMDSFFAVKSNPAADAKRKKKLQDDKAKKKQKVSDDRKKKVKGKK